MTFTLPFERASKLMSGAGTGSAGSNWTARLKLLAIKAGEGWWSGESTPIRQRKCQPGSGPIGSSMRLSAAGMVPL
ncbi:hypothetical protein D3C87_2128120 [compost metagenome]